MSQIVLATDQGPIPIRARVFGVIGVHPMLDLNCQRTPSRFMVTHIPTGLSLAQFNTKEAALKAARELAKLPGWAKLRKGVKPNDTRYYVQELRAHRDAIVEKYKGTTF